MAAFADDFNRPNSTDLGAGWVQVSGFWSIVSNQLSRARTAARSFCGRPAPWTAATTPPR